MTSTFGGEKKPIMGFQPNNRRVATLAESNIYHHLATLLWYITLDMSYKNIKYIHFVEKYVLLRPHIGRTFYLNNGG